MEAPAKHRGPPTPTETTPPVIWAPVEVRPWAVQAVQAVQVRPGAAAALVVLVPERQSCPAPTLEETAVRARANEFLRQLNHQN